MDLGLLGRNKGKESISDEDDKNLRHWRRSWSEVVGGSSVQGGSGAPHPLKHTVSSNGIDPNASYTGGIGQGPYCQFPWFVGWRGG